jgi:hypothetical protein
MAAKRSVSKERNHVSTRGALIEAVYQTEVEKLAAAERKFDEAMPRLKRCAVDVVVR